MVQLENEYGSYGLQTGHCDIEYMIHLRNLVTKYLGPEVLMYTTDGAGDDYFRCGGVPGKFQKYSFWHIILQNVCTGAYITVDFGLTNNVESAFQAQRNFQPHGPLVNSEYYPGWLDYWGQPHNTVDANKSAIVLDRILATGANVNVYMAHGGTSFGFGNGANTGKQRKSITEE